MKRFSSQSTFVIIVILVLGGIFGGIIGELINTSEIGNTISLLTEHHEIFNINNIAINLYIIEFNFGLHFAPNVLSIIGIIIAWFIARKL
ncbi:MULTISPECIES: DUF4321 domain-containing protein [Megasphaera]|jgi:hypothetical protein|uniref:DUF4321 domain-containing protein n=1 Tax=Megasphaera hutchinsoni TaxID=1588748 RepID=A0A134CEM4_9FIRM|nr:MULTISPECIES: DUF4321 domain-containing protein [Megasphaera]MUP48471.1 DUF4321 domain-containing protein [Veillonellaceae bacterium M2-8]MUP58938.1 DUF4321 domain-containing protein [Veillonellaceae bacterium M2-4]EGS33087.1 hypothetical protein HMPREF1040_0648 [Megasphaera sp. UPII 135-E]KXB90642.1 hypothetical protein HMPREF3182_01066 [Megasphaera hutchinsoni]PNH22487.1 hypothetical protein CAL30_00550 [Megasphaera genomosp. type_2]